ncbi:MAG: hypothetical protein SFT81_05510 [Candidatus Caenarcaniphilales bacterium]|nr:hypothetical protein [Candidatus Caenarcaniphilales bacterium]
MLRTVNNHLNSQYQAIGQRPPLAAESLTREQAIQKLKDFYQSRGQTEKTNEAYLKGLVEKIYARYDDDGDGKLDRTDLVAIKQDAREKRINRIAESLSQQSQTNSSLDLVA